MAFEFALFAGLFARMGLIADSHFQSAVMLFFGIVVTRFFWHWETGFVTFVHHFHPDVVWYRESKAPSGAECQLLSTVHVKFPVGFSWGLLNIFSTQRTTSHRKSRSISCVLLNSIWNLCA